MGPIPDHGITTVEMHFIFGAGPYPRYQPCLLKIGAISVRPSWTLLPPHTQCVIQGKIDRKADSDYLRDTHRRLCVKRFPNAAPTRPSSIPLISAAD
jgi:hypothetical protein